MPATNFRPCSASTCALEPTQYEGVFSVLRRLAMKLKQFAALRYRMRDDDLEILLITTRKKGRSSVPKGWPIKRCAPHETAATETYEEAGVRGSVSPMKI